MIAIWTTAGDTTAARVQRELVARNARVVRIDTDRYGVDYALGWDFSAPFLVAAGQRIAASDISAIYYRRPAVTEVPRNERDFGVHESWYFSRAILMLAQSAAWMNHPSAVMMAENKLRQLSVALRAGLEVPRSQLVSSAEDAFAFYESTGRRCVCKPGYAGVVSTDEETLAVYAWRLEPGLTKNDFGSVESSPTFLQEEVPKCSDIRLTVVGEQMFGVRIKRKDCSVLDWRRELGNGLDYERVSVSHKVESCVRELMRELSISYGAVDFAERTDGGWSFLEVNPAGQWEWLEPAAGVPIAGAIASWLQSR